MSNRDKQTFALGNCRRQVTTRPTLLRSVANGRLRGTKQTFVVGAQDEGRIQSHDGVSLADARQQADYYKIEQALGAPLADGARRHAPEKAKEKQHVFGIDTLADIARCLDLSPAAPPSWPDLFRPSQGEGSAFVRTRRRHNMFSGPAARIGVDGRDKHGHDGRGL